jgi:thiol-disulfide isomerase/thioredoxin
MKRQTLLTIVLMALIAISSVSVAHLQSRKTPNFSFSDLTGKQLSLASTRGKVVLVDQWATWCGPCKKEIPNFAELQKKYPDKLVVIGISYDDDQSTLSDFLRKDPVGQKINYPIVFGTGLKQQPFGNPEGLPTLFVIDKKGTLRQQHEGYISPNELNSLVEKLIAEN